INRDTVETHLALGNLFRRRGEVDRAIRVHQHLIARPNLSREEKTAVLLELGEDYMRAGLLDRAETLFADLVAMDALAPPALKHLISIYQHERDWNKAIEHARRLQVASGEPQVALIAQFHCELAEGARLRSDLDVAEVMVLAPVSLGGAKLGGASQVVMLLQDRQTQDDPHAMAAQAMEALANTGTKVLLMVHEQARAIMEQRGSFITREHMRLATDNGSRTRSGGAGVQVILITPELAQAILDHGKVSLKKAAATAGKKRLIIKVPVRFTYASRNGPATGENVLGFISGSDKKDELVVVTAHYDHVGVIDGEVYNGADDDGSGTVAVLGMAKAFAKAKAEGHGPRRSMLFMTVSGEEKGLLGSRWYTDHPVFPLDSTVADLNIDMIGRTDTVYGDSSSYVYVIGSRRISNELGNIIERENDALAKLHLDYTFDAADDPNRFYYRSDHYNFAKHGVPIAFFFNGVHADYHGPYDEVDKIRFDLLRQRTLLVFHTAWVLANSETRLAKDGPEGGK
ncbi:MAG TPA: M28 family peptidase, partial [Flavobacteriales bacterium]|nr:M28 family peptidase [Flavobacteriales bacterium]